MTWSSLTKAAAMCLVFAACGWTQPPAARPRPNFHAESNLVLVPVTVTDARGANIESLSKERFTVFENGRSQPIATFHSEDVPCSIGIVLDISTSMRDTLSKQKAAVHTFLQLSNPDDDYFLVTASSKPNGGDNPVTDAREIEEMVRSQYAGGDTALVDTLHLAVDRLRVGRHARKALFVISDGMDNNSRFTKGELFRLIVESDIQIYTIGLDQSRAGVKPVEMAETLRGLAFMEDLAAKTGGLNLTIKRYQDQATAASAISKAIRNQYTIGYRSPEDGQAGQWRRIQIKVDVRRANVYARTGYWRQ